MKVNIWEDKNSTSTNRLVFIKSPKLNWNNKKVEVSFEDALQDFSPIELDAPIKNNKKFRLSNNNFRQGFTIRLKVKDFLKNRRK